MRPFLAGFSGETPAGAAQGTWLSVWVVTRGCEAHRGLCGGVRPRREWWILLTGVLLHLGPLADVLNDEVNSVLPSL